jgi:putative tricarboxylic transport membrane protein
VAQGGIEKGIKAFDLVIMYVFGLLGYLLVKQDFPAAPVILGLILGPLLDENLRRALQTSGGSLFPFFTRPVCVIILLLIVYSLLGQTKAFHRFTSATIGRLFQRVEK